MKQCISLKMCLKMFLTNPNRISHRFSSSCINSLFRQSRVITFSRSTFCTVKSEKTKLLGPAEYYRQYVMSKPESYPCYFDILTLEKEVKNSPESYKLLSDLLNNLEEDPNVDELQKIIDIEFSCGINEICKKIIFIGKNINKRSKTTEPLIQQIDKVLWRNSLSSNELLRILTAVSISNINSSLKNKIWKCFKNIHSLNPHQVVEIFLIMPKRNFSKFEEKYEVLSYVNDRISLFNIDELGIVTKGMTEGNFTFSHHNIANAILGKVIEEIENIHSIPLENICKALLKLSSYSNPRLLLDLQEKSIPYISNFSIPALLELLELGMKSSNLNSSLWETAARKFKENLSNLSAIHILRIQKQTIVYNIEDNELLKLIIDEFQKYKNDKKQHENLVYFLCNLTYCNLYPKDLFDKAFSEEFVSKEILPSKKSAKLKLSWWILYANLECEKPEYLNYKLNNQKRNRLHSLCQAYLWNNKTGFGRRLRNYTDKVESYLKNLYGENAVVRTDCLPQHDCGLVLRFNDYLEVQPIPEDFHLNSKGYVKKPLEDNNYWVFLNMVAFNQYSLNRQTVFSHLPTQCRQLKALGYIPIMVPVEKYYDHMKNNTQDTFITDLIQNSLKEKEKIL